MSKKITIDPITRLEGHGKIDIFLDDNGNVENAFLQVPELRGFEKFVEGRLSEDMPQITSRICGVCPSAHHMASVKALDALYHVEPTETARLIRELFYCLHMFEDHVLHFYILAGPDFIVGPDAEKKDRNVLGVINVVGTDVGKQVIEIRKRARDLMSVIGGKAIHHVLGLPGGVAKQISEDTRQELKAFSKDAVEFAKFTIDTFHKIVLENKSYLDLILSDVYYHETYYMGMVDKNNQLNFYDGDIRVIDPEGAELLKFKPSEYLDVIGEHVEEWSYIKFPFLKQVGWNGFKDGKDSGIYRVAPLSRLNVSNGLSTSLANAEYNIMYETLGKKPVHHSMGIHWARLIETMYAAEKLVEYSEDPKLTSDDIRNMDLKTPDEGVGIVEAPRGTLIHHYKTDERGIMTGCNLIVASLGNSAAMCMAVERAAKKLIIAGEVNDALLNKVEMAFRTYDPCLGCATHSLPGKMPLKIALRNKKGKILSVLSRDSKGLVKL